MAGGKMENAPVSWCTVTKRNGMEERPKQADGSAFMSLKEKCLFLSTNLYQLQPLLMQWRRRSRRNRNSNLLKLRHFKLDFWFSGVFTFHRWHTQLENTLVCLISSILPPPYNPYKSGFTQNYAQQDRPLYTACLQLLPIFVNVSHKCFCIKFWLSHGKNTTELNLKYAYSNVYEGKEEHNRKHFWGDRNHNMWANM